MTQAKMSQPVQQLADLIEHSRSTVFFGGAGVSTESGIPDFRSESGLYAAQSVYGHAPEELISHGFFVREPELFFRYYKESLVYRDAQPNAAHCGLAQLERDGKLAAVITQNIDGLHQMAGSQNVIELHGTNLRQYCTSCGRRYSLDYIFDESNCRDSGIPICQDCGGVVRPDVVLYEESLDTEVLGAAIDAIRQAELLIVGGTSLAVYPAAGLLQYFSGSDIVLINLSTTPYDARAQLVIHDSIGAVISAVVQA